MVSKLILILIVLYKLGKSYSLKPDTILSYENATDYELVYFNLNKFYSFGIIEFNYNDQHYKVELIKNNHISPIINHQTDTNISITHHNKPDDSWYDFTVCTHTHQSDQNRMLHITTIVLFFMYDKPLDLVKRFIYSE